MTGRSAIAWACGVAAATLLVIAGSVWRIEVRHSAPYGFSKTVDFDRAIAVSGGYVIPNYDDVNRLDLDLRAYYSGSIHDLTIHIRPVESGARDVRTIQLDVPASRVFHVKPTFADPFLTVRFSPIGDSAGKTYYVWVESGPRNRDDVLALWSIKSYSRVPASAVVSAFVSERATGESAGFVRLALNLLIAGLVLSTGWLVWRLAATSLRPSEEVSADLRRWHRWETDGIQ